MKKQSFPELIKSSISDLYKNPIITIPSVILFLALFALSNLSQRVLPSLQTTTTLTLWITLFVIISLAAMSYALSGLIGMAKNITERKSNESFFRSANKYWLKNLILIIILIMIYSIVRWTSHFIVLYLGRAFSIPLNVATFLFFLLLFGGLITFVLSLTFSSFALVLEGLSIIGSLKRSISLSMHNYLYLLTTLVFFFIISQLIYLIPYPYAHLIQAIIFIPFILIVLTKLYSFSK